MKNIAQFQEFMKTTKHEGGILICMKVYLPSLFSGILLNFEVPVSDKQGFKNALEAVREATLAKEDNTMVTSTK